MAPVLSNRWEERRDDGYDVVVIGSGYGGAITAARIAQADLDPKPTVCILERGREWPVGSFPDRSSEVTAEIYNESLNPLGLYEFDLHKEITVIKGSGLGGTSLVNANVAIRPDPAIFNDWPSAIRQAAQIEEGHEGSLWNYYRLAAETLDVSPHPEGHQLKKVNAMQKRAAQLGQTADLLNIAVNFTKDGEEIYSSKDGTIVKRKCIDCGDCVTGCNVGAKNTLYMNYLPLAKKGGAHIFTQTEVDYLEKAADDTWLIHVISRGNTFSSSRTTIRARTVILAAGALGSTGILLRSGQHGLNLGVGVGMRFSGNGDFFGLAYNGDQITDVLGWGNHPDDPIAKVVRPGPTIVSIVRYRHEPDFGQRFIVEDVAFPRALRDAAAGAFRFLKGKDTDTGLLDKAAELQRELKDVGGADPKGALNGTMLYLCMGMDDAGGTLSLNPLGKLEISWPDAGSQAIFARINEECLQHAKALGATFIESPLWKVSPWKTLLTAHPLGGCPVGEDGSDGACDHRGRVFAGKGADVHQGLYVADGATIRTSLGVNPFLTISAFAERIALHIIMQKKSMPA